MMSWIYGIGICGQIFFLGRIVLQWIASEQAKDSVVPMSFWVMSIVGSIFLFVYAILRKDPVFSVGQAFGLGIYLRNIQLMNKKNKSALLSN